MCPLGYKMVALLPINICNTNDYWIKHIDIFKFQREKVWIAYKNIRINGNKPWDKHQDSLYMYEIGMAFLDTAVPYWYSIARLSRGADLIWLLYDLIGGKVDSRLTLPPSEL